MSPAPRKWYREPMLWLALGIPLATIIGGVETMRLAFLGDSDDVEPQPVTRTAQAQETDLGPDMVAARRKLRARLSHDRATQRVIIALPGVAASEGPLTLDLIHPIYAREDRRMVMVWSDGAWRASAAWPPGKWKLTLVDQHVRWRLAGLVDATSRNDRFDTHLQSALAPR